MNSESGQDSIVVKSHVARDLLQSAGLVEWTDYYSSTTAGTLTTTAAGVAGYVQDTALSQGVAGTKHYQSFADYVKHSVSGKPRPGKNA